MRRNSAGFVGDQQTGSVLSSAQISNQHGKCISRSVRFGVVSAQPQTLPFVWRSRSDQIFSPAAREHKFVLLDLEAAWCHWCHVMDRQTYRDSAAPRLLGKSYIAVKVAQDSRPDISNRYEDYGWPATVIFNAEGGAIVKRQRCLPPIQMASILQAAIDDPSPGPSVERSIAYAATPFLPPALPRELDNEFDSRPPSCISSSKAKQLCPSISEPPY